MEENVKLPKFKSLVLSVCFALVLVAPAVISSSCCDIDVYNRNVWYDAYYIRPIADCWGDEHHFYLLKVDELEDFERYAENHKPSDPDFKYKDREVSGTSTCDIPCPAIKMVDGSVWLFEELPGAWEEESVPPPHKITVLTAKQAAKYDNCVWSPVIHGFLKGK